MSSLGFTLFLQYGENACILEEWVGSQLPSMDDETMDDDGIPNMIEYCLPNNNIYSFELKEINNENCDWGGSYSLSIDDKVVLKSTFDVEATHVFALQGDEFYELETIVDPSGSCPDDDKNYDDEVSF